MSFAFIPRKVVKRNPIALNTKPPPACPQPPALPRGKERKVHPSAEESAILFSLSLSDYSLWSDADLRMKLSKEPNYIPLHYLLQHSQVLSPTRGVPHTLLVKSLKTHLSEVLDFRLLVATPQPWFNRSGATSSQDTGGGYEIRLKAWDPASRPLRSKPDWVKCTVYVENVPIHYRSIPALVKFLVALLPTRTPLSFFDSISRIQHVYLPPHHQDKPGSLPTFKGFALVTFLDESDAQCILDAWPWQPQAETSSRPETEADSATKDAAKFGFRTTTKPTWETLRAEYLLYKQQLIHEINAQQDAAAPPAKEQTVSTTDVPRLAVRPAETSETRKRKDEAAISSTSTGPVITPHSPYPYGCLIFVKNIHPDTNKTTLKTFFGKTLSQPDVAVNGGIDYLDFNKGMDTCYLRLSTPECAQILASHYSSQPTIQTKALDDTGSPMSSSESDLKPVSLELVLGTRESVYWNRIPEKIRRGAVEKALQLQGKNSSNLAENPAGDARPKKRRKR